MWANRRYSSNASAGAFQPSVLRGLVLRARATASRAFLLWALRSVPFGKYCRSNPFVFSFVPRCHGLCGSPADRDAAGPVTTEVLAFFCRGACFNRLLKNSGNQETSDRKESDGRELRINLSTKPRSTTEDSVAGCRKPFFSSLLERGRSPGRERPSAQSPGAPGGFH